VGEEEDVDAVALPPMLCQNLQLLKKWFRSKKSLFRQ
jgi:hypothetical protein